ncbi:MAG: GatB/YqeY domain-containing protein [Calditrichaeota bacterium]|nr:MAG: GatB/YqeY domain-containing protein [Calditrichota bacterium]
MATTLEARLLEDMKAAMKSGDKLRLETIRGLRSQLKNKQIEKGAELSEDEVLQVLMSAVKRRREAIEQYRAGGREDLVEKESRELEIIQSYLPQPLSQEELNQIIEEAIQTAQASSPRDMGKVMGLVMPRVKGRAEGKLVQQLVREKLAGA